VIPRAGRVLALDLGTVRTGVAVSDSSQVLASPLTTLPGGAALASVRELVDAEDAVGVLVGLPRNMDGSTGPAARAAQAAADALAAGLQVPVIVVDERLTTVVADRSLRTQGRHGPARRRVIDRSAATVLLQGWLDGRSGGAGGDPVASRR